MCLKSLQKGYKRVSKVLSRHTEVATGKRKSKNRTIDLHLEHLVEHRPEFPPRKAHPPSPYKCWSLILHKHAMMGVQFDVTAL